MSKFEIVNELESALETSEREYARQLQAYQELADTYKKNWYNEVRRAVAYGRKLDLHGIERPAITVKKKSKNKSSQIIKMLRDIKKKRR